MEKEALITEILERSVDRVFPSKEALEATLRSEKKLSIYIGMDPTGPHLHLGHATNLLKLKQLQDLGHHIIFLVGDFTARIGDPTDKFAARKPLTSKEIKTNLRTFKQQAGRVLRFSGRNSVTIKFNAKWLGKLKFADVIEIASHVTVQQMLKRDMFQERIKADKQVGLHEFLYPLMQGYDSVAMNVDMEMGGTDQTFNMLVGRDLVKSYAGKEKFVLTTKLLLHPKTGKKLMNKSEGGLINLDDSPEEIFGKVMALDDEAMMAVAEHATLMPFSEVHEFKKQIISGVNPRDVKLKIAFEVVKTYYDEKDAKKAQEAWVKLFSEKNTDVELPEVRVPDEIKLTDLIVLCFKSIDIVKSKSQAVQLISQNAVQIDSRVWNDIHVVIKPQAEVIRIGRYHFRLLPDWSTSKRG